MPTRFCPALDLLRSSINRELGSARASVLTPERVARLHDAGFADPGRAPNYWKRYAVDQVDDAGIARELLTVLHDVYGYSGLPTLKVKTEKGRP